MITFYNEQLKRLFIERFGTSCTLTLFLKTTDLVFIHQEINCPEGGIWTEESNEVIIEHFNKLGFQITEIVVIDMKFASVGAYEYFNMKDFQTASIRYIEDRALAVRGETYFGNALKDLQKLRSIFE